MDTKDKIFKSILKQLQPPVCVHYFLRMYVCVVFYVDTIYKYYFHAKSDFTSQVVLGGDGGSSSASVPDSLLVAMSSETKVMCTSCVIAW